MENLTKLQNLLNPEAWKPAKPCALLLTDNSRDNYKERLWKSSLVPALLVTIHFRSRLSSLSSSSIRNFVGLGVDVIIHSGSGPNLRPIKGYQRFLLKTVILQAHHTNGDRKGSPTLINFK